MTITIKPAHVATTGLRFKERGSTKGIVVHCSATKPSQDWGATEIDRMHRAQGFLCIGYQLVIRRDGTVERGRPINAEGSHCRDDGKNRTHVGICLVGGISEKPQTHTPGNPWNGSDAECNFTAAQLATLKDLIEWLSTKVYQNGNLEVIGHRDVKGVSKACPSFDVKHWLKTGVAKL